MKNMYRGNNVLKKQNKGNIGFRIGSQQAVFKNIIIIKSDAVNDFVL